MSLNKKLSVSSEIFAFELLVKGPRDSQNINDNTIILDAQPELSGETLWLLISHTLVTGHGKIQVIFYSRLSSLLGCFQTTKKVIEYAEFIRKKEAILLKFKYMHISAHEYICIFS